MNFILFLIKLLFFILFLVKSFSDYQTEDIYCRNLENEADNELHNIGWCKKSIKIEACTLPVMCTLLLET